MSEVQRTKCMIPECDKPSEWKGICRSCYGQARRLIDEGKTSWEELATMGMCLMDKKPFTNLFYKKKAEIMKEIREKIPYDPEVAHVEAEKALLEYIDDPEVGEVYESIKKWYS